MQFNGTADPPEWVNINDKNRHQPTISVAGTVESYRDLIRTAINQTLAGMRVHIAHVETKVKNMETIVKTMETKVKDVETKLVAANTKLTTVQQKTQDYVDKCSRSLECLTEALDDTVELARHVRSQVEKNATTTANDSDCETYNSVSPAMPTPDMMRYWH